VGPCVIGPGALSGTRARVGAGTCGCGRCGRRPNRRSGCQDPVEAGEAARGGEQGRSAGDEAARGRARRRVRRTTGGAQQRDRDEEQR